MRFLLIAIFILFGTTLHATTPQDPDVLIWQNDTIYLDKYPLEELIKIQPALREKLLDTDCMSSGCWRNYIATWKIIEDSLCLVELREPCERNIIPLEKIFDKKDIEQRKVVAKWYTGSVKAGFGKILEFSEKEFKNIYEKIISFEVAEGKVSSIEVKSK